MKKFILALAICFPVVALAQEPSPPSVTPPALPEVVPDQYKSDLTHCIKLSKEFTNKERYKDYRFKDRQTNKIRSFTNLSEKDQYLYMLIQGEKLTLYLEILQRSWQGELKSIKEIVDKIEVPEKEESEKLKELQLRVKEVDDVMNELMLLRKSTAVTFEKFIAETFVLLKDDITESERDQYFGAIKKYHDKHNLIERK